MSTALVGLLVIELTLGLLVGGYLLYQIQTSLALVILQSCGDAPAEDAPPMDSGLLLTETLHPEVLDAEPTRVVDETETTGTFTGAAWK